MLRFELQTPDFAFSEKYIQLHKDTFGAYFQHNPVSVYLAYDGDRFIGFITVNPMTTLTVMIQFIGFTKDVMENTPKEQKVRYALEAVEIFKGMGFKYLTGMVEGTNTKALIWALKAGCKILGLRSRGVAPVLLEIVKEV